MGTKESYRLKQKILKTLETFVDAVKNEDWKTIDKMIIYSPAGDGMGCENSTLRAPWVKGNDYNDVFSELEKLEEMIKKENQNGHK